MLKTLGRETKGFRLVSVLTPIFMIAEVIMEMIIPKLMASIIDNGVTPGNMQVIYTVGAQMVVAALFGLLFGILGAVAGSHAATGFARNLRRGMFRNIQTFSFANIDKYSTAGLVTRMTTDVTNIQNAYQMLLRMSVRAPASMIVALIMSYTINRRLANIYLIAVILLGCALAFIMSRATKYFGEAFRKYDDLNESVQENVSAIRVVKAYVREKFEGREVPQGQRECAQSADACRADPGLERPAHAADRLQLHPAHLLDRCPAYRQLRRNDLHHRRPDEHAELLHEHPYEPDDAVHGVRHDHDVCSLRQARGRGAGRAVRPDER